MQPENARIAHRAVKLAKLAEIYDVPLSEENAANLAKRFAKVPDNELDNIVAGASPIIGCTANIAPMFAGYSSKCVKCPYYLDDHTDDKCALKEK